MAKDLIFGAYYEVLPVAARQAFIRKELLPFLENSYKGIPGAMMYGVRLTELTRDEALAMIVMLNENLIPIYGVRQR